MLTRTVALVLFLLPPTLGSTEPAASFQFRELQDKSLSFKIGEMLFQQPSEGCGTCHGGQTVKGSVKNQEKNKSAGAILSDSTTWTSYKITQNYTPNEKKGLHQRQIALSLIRLGATDWNKTMVPVIRKFSSGDMVFFDDRMIGIHSKYLRRNSKSVIRVLKRNKVRFKSKELMDIMATSVFHYLEKTYQPVSQKNE